MSRSRHSREPRRQLNSKAVRHHDQGNCNPELLANYPYTRLQTVWSLPGHSRQANKGHRLTNGPGRLADEVVQPTTQSAEGCASLIACRKHALYLHNIIKRGRDSHELQPHTFPFRLPSTPLWDVIRTS